MQAFLASLPSLPFGYAYTDPLTQLIAAVILFGAFLLYIND